MRLNFKKMGLLSLFCISLLVAFGQTSFTMTKDKGHYYINTVVNGHDSVWVFVESGIPGLFINEESYMRLFDDSLYEKVDSKYSNVRFSHGSYKIIQLLFLVLIILPGVLNRRRTRIPHWGRRSAPL